VVENHAGKPLSRPRRDRARPTRSTLTDEESRIRPFAGGGFEQCYNAQALVDTKTLLVVIPEVTHANNDKQQIAPRYWSV
jgi:hypothetical protein